MISTPMKEGFYPALGTPTDENGKLIKNSFDKEIALMLDAGAKGLLCMGSMGKMATINNYEYPNIARFCFESVSKKMPVMVGVMDCSVSRIMERIDSLKGIEFDGVVATAPYYFKVSPGSIVNFFSLLAKKSMYPVYIYDLPPVTQAPITIDMLKPLMNNPNICGIKTANLNLIFDLERQGIKKEGFSILYSGLDLFDAAISLGIKKNLDGMFTCTPLNSKKMYEDLGKRDQISKHLTNILNLRNLFLKGDVFQAYSYAMNLLGCPGNYHIDYEAPVSENLKEEIYQCMKDIGEI